MALITVLALAALSYIAVSPDVRPIASAVVGAALGAAVVYAGYQAKQKRDGAAVIDLYNYIVDVSMQCRTKMTLWLVLRVADGSLAELQVAGWLLAGSLMFHAQYLKLCSSGMSMQLGRSVRTGSAAQCKALS